MMKSIISCDLGGTKCAAGVIEYNTTTSELVCKKKCSVKLKETTSLSDLIEKIETNLNKKFSEADAICIGGAGQYNGKSLIYEGAYPYPMNFAELADAQKWPHFDVIHDYAPILCATFTSYMGSPENIKRLNTAPMNLYGRRVTLGLGTGLGMKDGVLFPNGEFWLGQNEVGHIGITFPPTAELEKLEMHFELMKYLNKKNSPVTFEKILSGPGTVNLYHFFYPDRETLSAEQIGVAMRESNAVELNNAFAWYLGLFIGTIQLIFLPEGGIWITGGVTLSHLDIFENKNFFSGITASPAYLAQRLEYPLGIFTNQDHALIGGGYYATQRLLS